VVTDPTTAANICAQSSFQNVDELMPFVAGLWYGGVYLTSLQTSTGMTQAETDAFYNTADTTSFGYALSAECGLISVKYGCANTANCTNDELSLLQWGSSFVTQNPLYVLANDPYTPAQKTVVNWGAYGFAGLTASPEYGYFV
jgi:hypothetical protein